MAFLDAPGQPDRSQRCPAQSLFIQLLQGIQIERRHGAQSVQRVAPARDFLRLVGLAIERRAVQEQLTHHATGISPLIPEGLQGGFQIRPGDRFRLQRHGQGIHLRQWMALAQPQILKQLLRSQACPAQAEGPAGIVQGTFQATPRIPRHTRDGCALVG